MRVLAVAALLAAAAACSDSSLGELADLESASDGVRHRILSRRRRYLVYPEGSSLQLVYCLTVPTIVPVPFFKFGWTLGLAWELPSDGKQIVEYKKKLRQALRKPTTEPPPPPPPDHHDDDHHPDGYPGFDAYSHHFGYDHMHQGEVLMHRRDRRTLYAKAEGAFSSLGVDGRSCVYRFLCEAEQRVAGTGTFLQEILRVIFTLPEARGRDLDNADLRHYDEAHRRRRRDAAAAADADADAGADARDCDLLYPECDIDSIFDYQLPLD
ncbi:uncharacterized protein LOC126282285 [Schistocerca gregaria]|uniref:uncharacterized protein LOC126282285 n=1 Tax=Schistocerca gregaria TaxID=7010 RepID=UPI00211F20E7|nr:uncharacterized protein LOC126282285 [Schistocerca gregaria]